jgi:hypothetical protein
MKFLLVELQVVSFYLYFWVDQELLFEIELILENLFSFFAIVKEEIMLKISFPLCLLVTVQKAFKL